MCLLPTRVPREDPCAMPVVPCHVSIECTSRVICMEDDDDDDESYVCVCVCMCMFVKGSVSHAEG